MKHLHEILINAKCFWNNSILFHTGCLGIKPWDGVHDSKFNCHSWQPFWLKIVLSLVHLLVSYTKFFFLVANITCLETIKIILIDVRYQEWDAVFHHQMKQWEESWKYNVQQSIFDELRGVLYGDETLLNAWYYFSNKMTLEGEIKNAKMSNF